MFTREVLFLGGPKCMAYILWGNTNDLLKSWETSNGHSVSTRHPASFGASRGIPEDSLRMRVTDTLRISGTTLQEAITYPTDFGKFAKSSTQICQKIRGICEFPGNFITTYQLGDEKNHRSHPIFFGNQETSLL